MMLLPRKLFSSVSFKDMATVNEPFQAAVSFYNETSHLIYRTSQMTNFNMKYNTGMKWLTQRFNKLFQ